MFIFIITFITTPTKINDLKKKDNLFENNQTCLFVFSLVNANYYHHLVVPNWPMNLEQYEYFLVFHLVHGFLVAKLHLMMVHRNVVVMDDRSQLVDYLKKEIK
jgi:hypothetical protein